MRFRRPLFALVAALLAFAATAAVLSAGDEGAPAPGGDAAPLRDASTRERIARLATAARETPGDARIWTALGAAELQLSREVFDPNAYDRSERALRRALMLAPGDPGALTERAALKLARHDFRGGLADARAARAAAPEANKPLGALVDALVELGRYGDARASLQAMVDRKPNVDAYARVAYLRELHGDLDGAAEALSLAASAGGEVPENAAYIQALRGDLALSRGRLARARAAYRRALAQVPRFAPARFGLARVLAGRGRRDDAIAMLRRLVADAPAPAYAVTLGELEIQAAAARGRPARARRLRRAARRHLALTATEARLLRNANVGTDVELALFEADHGSPRRAVALGRRAWAAAPSIRSADALGWALTRAGRPRAGLRFARQALRLGTREPGFLVRAGGTALRAGDHAAARRWLRRVPPRVPLHGARALRLLGELR